MNQVSITALSLAIEARQPVILVGMPGSAKTDIVNAVADIGYERPCSEVIASIYAQEDFGGYPAPDFDRGFVRMLPNEALFGNLKPDHVLFWDEVNQIDDHKQGALMRIILKCVAGSHPLPPGVSHVAAINPPEQSAGGTDIAPPLANRFMWVSWKPDTKMWCEAALHATVVNGKLRFPTPSVPPPLPVDWRQLIPVQLSLVVAYGRARQDVLAQYPKTHAEACGPWPSFRSWTNLAMMDAACIAGGHDDDVRLCCFGGLIGTAQATEYLTYLRDLDLPDVEVLLLKPDAFKLPKRGDQRYAVLASVTGAVVRSFSDARYHAAWRIFNLAREGGAGDIAVASATSLAGMHRHLKGRGPAKDMEAFLPLLKKAGIVAA